MLALQATERRRRRSAERGALVAAFQREDLLSATASDPPLEAVASAAHRYIGRTKAMIALTQVDDISREADPVNVPDASPYPNWRRRLHMPLEDIARESVITTALAEGRAPP